ncbi:MAG: hypothetical protein F6K30_23040 [Cyanothece sp. SIO2G6]|nr:hypothetical protein [Cyanothece sp. SIO2G6]
MNKNQNRQDVICFTGKTKVINRNKPSTLVARQNHLIFYIGLGKYKLSSNQVVYLIAESNAMRIVHNSKKCPENILFSTSKKGSIIIRQIKSLGFIPSGDSNKIREGEGSGISWRTPLIFLMLQITPILLFAASNYSQIEVFDISVKNIAWIYFLAFAIQFLLCIFIRLFPPLQLLFLKRGRLIEESSEYFNEIALISIVFSMIIILTKLNFNYSEVLVICLIPSALIFVNFAHRLRALIFDSV